MHRLITSAEHTHSVGIPWTNVRNVRRSLYLTTRHDTTHTRHDTHKHATTHTHTTRNDTTQTHTHETNIKALGGIQTRSHRNRKTEESRRKPRGHRKWHRLTLVREIHHKQAHVVYHVWNVVHTLNHSKYCISNARNSEGISDKI